MNEKIIIKVGREYVDLDALHNFLSEQSYWSQGIAKERVETAINNSLCFSVFYENAMIGFARVLTDFVTLGYLADVYILPEYRGRGYSKQLMEFIVNYPDLQSLRRFALRTRDAHGLYEQFGWKEITEVEKWMERTGS